MNHADDSDEIRCAAYFKALAEPLRLQIVKALQTGPLSVSDLACSLEQEIGTVSHHLRVLFRAGLVSTQREGKYIYYSLSSDFHKQASNTRKIGSLDFGCCKLDISPTSN
ncbi:ArsR/SmtB family transcription factor [Allorhodopirellula heiligendammensis]|uniref:HTH-type transcriptional regulator NmtR n=1 Tax=Allorhodopirellula heiligendammensis TaxID=2714739 RepID=A0A5C6C4Q3_9BACT|nr:metalloregulator ArsR/SmtB family transcription factor [Allorhodopirellula heiligendammensis]TWU19168.1 HTH-type transcriptional regulator NmtR [Allorhodopirellula heiligendammensis]